MSFEKTEPNGVPENHGEPGEQTVLPATKSVQRNLDHAVVRVGDVAFGERDAEKGGETAEDGNAEDCPSKKDAVVLEGDAERAQPPWLYMPEDLEWHVPRVGGEGLAGMRKVRHSGIGSGGGWCIWWCRYGQTAGEECRTLPVRLPCLLSFLDHREEGGKKEEGAMVLSNLDYARHSPGPMQAW